MMGWQWHQLDHTQIICTSLQTVNHASTSPLSFYRPDALPAARPTASKQQQPFYSPESVYIVCWPSRWSSIVQSLVGLHWATSVQ